MEDLHSILDDVVQVDGHIMWCEAIHPRKDECAQVMPVLHKPSILFIQLGLQLQHQENVELMICLDGYDQKT